MLETNLNNQRLTRLAFGWSLRVWAHVIKKIDFFFKSPPKRVLELGASKLSMVALMFDGVADEIVISCYESSQKHEIEKYLLRVRE